MPPLNCILNSRNDNTALKHGLIGNVFGKCVPLQSRFLTTRKLACRRVVHQICQRPCTGHFLTSFTPFIRTRLSHPSVESVITEDFTSFTKHGLDHCPTRLPITYINNITTTFKSLLHRALAHYNHRIIAVIHSPTTKLARCRCKGRGGQANFNL